MSQNKKFSIEHKKDALLKSNTKVDITNNGQNKTAAKNFVNNFSEKAKAIFGLK